MTMKAIELSSRIGSQVMADKRELLSGAFRVQLRDLLERRGVLLFRGLELSEDEQRAFSSTLGKVAEQGDRGIYKITLDRSVTPELEYIETTSVWHVDGVYGPTPNLASILVARRLCEDGGRWTEFANTYAAYEDLPQTKKAWAERQVAVHSQEYLQGAYHESPSPEQRAEWRRHGEQDHPLVWTHRSGRKSLLLGYTAGRLIGMAAKESQFALSELMDWASQPQFVYRHHWQLGDTLIWDNTGVMHRVEPYEIGSGRLLSRTTLVGEESVEGGE